MDRGTEKVGQFEQGRLRLDIVIENPPEIVPTYALYGEAADTALDLWLHCESIPARSAIFDWQIGLHRHQSFFQFLYLSRGTGEFLLADERQALTRGFVVTVPPKAVHGFRFSQDVEGHVITVRIERIEVMLGGLPNIRAIFRAPRLMNLAGEGAAGERIASRIAEIASESAASREGQSALLEANLAILLIEIARLLENAATFGEPLKSVDRHARQFQALVDQHFRDQRAVSFYAGKLGISQTHLNRIARAAFDQSALGVINQRLMREAARDLTFSFMAVKEIAFSLGFDDPAYFTRFFTKHMGLSPAQFRAKQVGRG